MEPAAPAAPTGNDATRIDNPGLHDSTQVIPPQGEPPAAPSAWQPSEGSAPSSWGAPPAPAAPSGEQPAWGAPPASPQAPGGWSQPQGAPQGQAWGAAPQGQGAPQGPAWGAPAPAGGGGGDEASPLGGAAAVVGGLLAVIGLFIGWFELSAGGGSETFSGWDLASSDSSPFESNDPYLLLALGIVGIAIGALLFLGKFRPIARIAAVVVGVAIVAVVLRDWMTASDLVKDWPGVKISQQVGFFVPIVGAVLLGAAAVLPARK